MDPVTYLPCKGLSPYVKHHRVYQFEPGGTSTVLFPSGYIELAINISSGKLTTKFDNRDVDMPDIEVLGQLTAPTPINVKTSISLLVTRFYPETSLLFFPGSAQHFTNQSIDLSDILNDDAIRLYQALQNVESLSGKIQTVEAFLLNRLVTDPATIRKIKLVQDVCFRMASEPHTYNSENLAADYGFSERYLQKLFTQYTGLTPKLFFNIQRFNKALPLLRDGDTSLTSVAYECGYYDQSHFIKHFRTFTGTTPSAYLDALMVSYTGN